jgi:hypothetical protein
MCRAGGDAQDQLDHFVAAAAPTLASSSSAPVLIVPASAAIGAHARLSAQQKYVQAAAGNKMNKLFDRFVFTTINEVQVGTCLLYGFVSQAHNDS